jgi:hypothetical protein
MLPYKVFLTTIIDLDNREQVLNHTKKLQILDHLAQDEFYESLMLPYKIILTTKIDLDDREY